MAEHQKIILIGSRTGGPLIPLLGLKEQLREIQPNLDFEIIGIKGGFEEQAARAENLPLHYLPEVKGKPAASELGALRVLAPLLLPFLYLRLLARLSFSTLKSFFIIFRTRPVLILSMSNFLTVPVVWAGKLYNLLTPITRRPRVAMALHQLDIQNLTVKLAGPFVQLLTGGFPDAARRAGQKQVPNPVRTENFDSLTRARAEKDLSAEGLLPPGKKPLLLIFGGGSGSLFINNWLITNIPELCKTYRVLHLTGFLQDTTLELPEHKLYRHTQGLTNLMPAALVAAEVVIARAGMSTISELLYLKKKAYLIPIPGSHQVHNANAVADYFPALDQSLSDDWANDLIAAGKSSFKDFKKVKWNYYTKDNKYAYRDLLLGLLKK